MWQNEIYYEKNSSLKCCLCYRLFLRRTHFAVYFVVPLDHHRQMEFCFQQGWFLIILAFYF